MKNIFRDAFVSNSLKIDWTKIHAGTKLIKFIAVDKAEFNDDYTVEIHGLYDECQNFYILDEIIKFKKSEGE